MAHHHHPRIIKSLPPVFVKSSQVELDPKKYRLYRSFILLLLVLSAGLSILRLASSSSASSPSFSPSLVQRPPDTFLVETVRDLESLKTHFSSNKNHLQVHEEEEGVKKSHSCSSLIDGTSTSGEEGLLCCDRSHYRTDVCYMRGDIRTSSGSSSILLYGSRDGDNGTVETIRPYTRKWETSVMNTIQEVKLQPTKSLGGSGSRCDVRHKVPAIAFSTGGYTGNVYHEFNDGMIPLYITAERFKGEVVLVVLEYHSWWKTKYGKVVRKLTNYKMVDFSNDGRVHCFPEMIVGLRIHGELSIDPKFMPNGRGIQDFQSLLGQGFGGVATAAAPLPKRAHPKLAIFIRNKSRVMQNLRNIVKACERIGFDVQILNPKRTTPLSEIQAALGSADAMLAVHGAAMTHLLFMRPGAVLVQIVPLGLDWAADSYYGEPARKLGLKYVAYKVAPEESSLYKEYDRRDPVLTDPNAITSKGWSETKRVYLDRQNVRVNLRRFSRLMTEAHTHIITSRLQR
ncbi:EGF domain-specific O-linked N-acetylglucosamine transferase-like [Iris pallida]|uniref:EGF domain-specific O-linked N-acetylglucosamine transferase-like n=1 Tax=Iris pallida TaxID=29817 RepID=A0AAX6HYN4_IRIPA|nr:EGF domain-specific O-linked N-acetylglucosamine transferase-like [Iris pallida]KAJ6845821.1 EGF domain-specific O-linked N-acetylglucosamine transferase-like [Iris pallida]